MDVHTRLEPVRPDERTALIDVLRGFALWGVLLVNMMNYGGHLPQWTGAVDRTFHMAEYFFFEQRFWHLLSLLFGLGFAIQLERAAAKEIGAVPRYVRRLVILLGFGAVNYILWGVDILTDYALLGFLLLPLRRWPVQAVLAFALVMQLAPTVHGVVQNRWQRYEMARDPGYAGRIEQEESEQRQAARRRSNEYDQVMADGSFTGIAAYRAREYGRRLMTPDLRPWSESWWGFFGMFLFGVYVGKRRILQEYRLHRPLVRTVGWCGLGVGTAGMSLLVWIKFLADPGPAVPTDILLRRHSALVLSAIYVGFTAMTFFYAYIVAEWMLTDRARTLQRGFAAVGRTALSSYIAQSAAMNVIFMPWGFGLERAFGPAWIMLLSVPLYVVLMVLSVWWVKRFQFGPAEWLWRTLTYGTRQPMAIRPAREAIPA